MKKMVEVTGVGQLQGRMAVPGYPGFAVSWLDVFLGLWARVSIRFVLALVFTVVLALVGHVCGGGFLLVDDGIVSSQLGGLLGLASVVCLFPVSRSRKSVAKVFFDFVFALAMLVALIPVFVAIIVAIKIDSRGPIFFRQRRCGLDGCIFMIWKFRTMKLHHELPGIVQQATRSDRRITRVGRFLRCTSLDELPQFINVLRGEMSVVGPRPHAVEHDELYMSLISGYADRHSVKPGITGWAQVNGLRGETEHIERMEARIAYDLHYIKNWTFVLDLRIVVMTLIKGFSSTFAY